MEEDAGKESDGPPGFHGPQGAASRACDNCRIRKIRCDRASPCSNCRAAQSTCRTSPRLKEHRQRVLISHQYEKRIEIIDERLSGIERLLRDLAVSIPGRDAARVGRLGEPTNQSELPKIQPGSISTEPEPPETAPGFEGESSFSAQTVLASQLFEKAMGDSPHFEDKPEIIEALSSLKDILRRQSLPSSVHTLRFGGQKSRTTADLSQLELPPTNTVLSLLRLMKENHSSVFLTIPLVGMEHFIQMCKDLYFAVEDYSPDQFAIVNCFLGYLFEEYSDKQTTDSSAAKFREYSSLCLSNFETVINSFDMFIEPSYQNLLVLALGAFHATECSKISLCWNFVCAAARMCQSLGYHRSLEGNGDSRTTISQKQAVFWFIYILDKDLSLCLGRASTLQDYDIAFNHFDVPNDPGLRPWNDLYKSWIRCATIAGEIYEHLYSVRAFTESGEMRAKKAYQVANEIHQWRSDTAQIEISGALNHFFIEWLIPEIELGYFTLLTLIYRVIPPTQPPETPSGLSAACVDAARKAMQVHEQIAAALKDGDTYLWKGYITWALLHCPFAPFMVLFCHTIAASSLEDLDLLEKVSSSLQAAGRVSEGGDRLYKLCVVFYQVAKVYVDAQLKELERANNADPPRYSHPGVEFDPFLSALGIAPPIAAAPYRGMEGTAGVEPAMPGQQPLEEGMGQSLEDWFMGNQYMMGLLEPEL